jgi:hypothetical protein
VSAQRIADLVTLGHLHLALAEVLAAHPGWTPIWVGCDAIPGVLDGPGRVALAAAVILPADVWDAWALDAGVGEQLQLHRGRRYAEVFVDRGGRRWPVRIVRDGQVVYHLPHAAALAQH